MKKILILIVSLLILLNCSNDDDNGANATGVNIRIFNNSTYDYQNMMVDASTDNENVNMEFEALNSGQTTEYHSFSTARSFPYIELQIDGETYILLTLTTGHDEPLENGNYIFKIDANNSTDPYGKLSFELIIED